MLIIQKSWYNKHNNNTYYLCKNWFHLIYSELTEEELIWVCFYINLWLNCVNWTVQIHSRDLITLKIQYTEYSQSKCLYIYNVYREAVKENITVTLKQLNDLLKNDHWQYIIVKDFNLHHLTWKDLRMKKNSQIKQLI